MALPPEPIEEVLPGAEAAVMAEVTRVVKQSPEAVLPKSEATSLPTQAARQVVELQVKSVLFGSLAAVGARLEVLKPEGAYSLRPGNQGPFVLARTDQGVEIVGRYGPDTWPEAAVKSAATRLGKA